MTEHTFPLTQIVPNGSADLLKEIVPDVNDVVSDLLQADGPRVDAARGVFITSAGNEIELSAKPINALLLQRLSQQGKPKVPQVEVMLMGKHKQLEAHPQDPGYLALLDEWREEAEVRTGTYMFNLGVKGQPPQEFIDDHLPLFPDISPVEMKYLWVLSQLPLEDVNTFLEALISRRTPTSKGIEDAANFTA